MENFIKKLINENSDFVTNLSKTATGNVFLNFKHYDNIYMLNYINIMV